MKYEEEQQVNALTALHTIQEICRTCDCCYCPFGGEREECLISEEIPTNWEIGEFKIAKLLR